MLHVQKAESANARPGLLRSLIGSRKGATTLEYAFVASLVSLGAVAAMPGIAAEIVTKFEAPANGMAKKGTPATPRPSAP